MKSKPGKIDFDEACVTDDDNSLDKMERSDSAWIIRPSGCTNKQFSGDLAGVAPSSMKSAPGSGSGGSSSGWRAAAIVFIALFLTMSALSAFLGYRLLVVAKAADPSNPLTDYHYMEDGVAVVDMDADRKNF